MCGWRNGFQKTAAEERKSRAERQHVSLPRSGKWPHQIHQNWYTPLVGQHQTRPWPTHISQASVTWAVFEKAVATICWQRLRSSTHARWKQGPHEGLCYHYLESLVCQHTHPLLSEYLVLSFQLLLPPHGWVNTYGNCVREAVTVNNKFILFMTTQLTKGVLWSAGLDLYLPQLYPWSGKREFTTHSQWSSRVNYLMICDSHTFETLFDYFIVTKIRELFQEGFLQGVIANVSGKPSNLVALLTRHLTAINKNFNKD